MIHSHTIEVIPTPSLTHPFEKDLVIYRKEYVYPDWSHQDYVDDTRCPRTLSDDLLADVYQDCRTAICAQRHERPSDTAKSKRRVGVLRVVEIIATSLVDKNKAGGTREIKGKRKRNWKLRCRKARMWCRATRATSPP
jgi:hypothetical protein